MERRVKGHGVKSVYAGATNYPPAEREKIIARIDPAVVAAMSNINRAEWYPAAYVSSIYQAVVDVKGEDELRRIGYKVAEDAVGTFLRLVMKILTPAMFSGKFNSFWHQYFDHGEIRSDMSDIASDHVFLHLDYKGIEFPWQHVVTVGWVEYAFVTMGKKTVTVSINSEPGQVSVMPVVIFDVRW